MASKPITIVSADAHYGLADPADFREYLDPKYRGFLDELASETKIVSEAMNRIRPNLSDVDVVGDAGQTSCEMVNETFYSNSMDKRLAIMDSQGIVAEVTVSGSEGPAPFFSEANRVYAPELRAAGARALHRWLVDMAAQAGPRLILIGESGPCNDMAATIRELEWIAKQGFVSVTPPGMVAEPSLPPLTSDYYEPFWAACEDLGLNLHMHAGFGAAQGGFVWKFFEDCASGRLFAKDTMGLLDSDNHDSPFFLHMESRQPLWQLMMSGVFDRHPKLKLGMIELRSDWIPATLAYLDRRFAEEAIPVRLTPSEYWQRNCFAVPSGPRRVEIDQRYEIGVDNLLFGADIPHPEGTWPSTWKWLSAAFQGAPEADVRKILGENAIRIFRLDAAKLDKIAAKIGPTPADLFRDTKPDPRLLRAFDRSGGYLKPVENVNVGLIEKLFAHDSKMARGVAAAG